MGVTIDMGGGQTQNVTIDGFDTMNPDQQATAVQQVHDHLVGDRSFTGAAVNTFKGAAQGLGETMKLAKTLPDWVPGRESVATAGQSIEDSVGPPDQNYKSGFGNVLPDLRAGRYRQALGDVGRAGIEAAPGIASAVLGGLPGAAAYTAATGLGPLADERAANNGRATPNSRDAALAAVGIIPEIALNVVGAGRAGSALDKIGSKVLRVGAKIGAEGVAQAGANVVGQTAGSLGTDKGLTIDPNQTLAAGIAGAAGRGAVMIPGAARSLAGDTATGAMTRLQAAPDDPLAAARWGDLVDNTKTSLGPSATDFQANKATKSDAKVSILNQAEAYKAAFPDTDASDFRLVREATSAALNHTSDAGSLISRVEALDWDPAHLQPLVDNLRAVNAGKGGGFLNQANGPFRALGTVIGRVAEPIMAIASGHPMAAIGGVFAGGPMSKLGGSLGGVVDRLAGTNTPAAMLQAAKARQLLKAQGVDVGPNVNDALQASTQTLQRQAAQIAAQKAAAQKLVEDRLNANAENANFNSVQASTRANANADNANFSSVQASTRANANAENANLNAVRNAQRANANADNANFNSVRAAQRSDATQLNQAFNQQVPVAAQNRMNATARRNAIGLAAAGMEPSPGLDGVGDEAAAAAVSSAITNAEGILRRAGAEDPERSVTRLQVGNPPLSPTDVPPARSPIQAPPAGPSSPTVGGTGQAPQGPVVSSAGVPEAVTPDRGLAAFQQGVVAAGKARPNVADYHAALDNLAAAGGIPPETAGLYKSGISHFDSGVNRAVVRQHLGRPATPQSAPQAPSGGGAPIHNPLAYKGSIDRYNRAVADVSNAFRASGDAHTADRVLLVANAKSRGEKRRLAEGYAVPKAIIEHGPE